MHVSVIIRFCTDDICINNIKRLLPSMDVNIQNCWPEGGCFPEGNNPLRVNDSDVYNPLKAVTVLLYRTTDQGLGM